MKIKDVEKRTQMDRATLYYYEKEGLLSPERTENGYRIYSAEDLLMIEKIKLLRSLQISIEDLKAMKRDDTSLSSVLETQLELLSSEEKKSQDAKEICQKMLAQGETFVTLYPERYLKSEEDKAFLNRYEDFPEELPQVYDPIRRFFARFFDYTLYATLWYLTLYLTLRIDLQNRSFLYLILDQMVTMVLMLFVEPVLLTLYKTTPGKRILGLWIERPDGTPLQYHEGFSRTFLVLLEGMGFLVPLITLFTHVISYNRCIQGENQPWDKNIAYRIKDRKILRGVLLAVLYTILLSTTALIQYVYFMPPNRGNLTVEEFTENFNHYQRIYDLQLNGKRLKSSAAWESPYDFRDLYLPHHVTTPPNLIFTMKDGFVEAVSFDIDVRDTDFYVYHYGEYMSLISLALMTPELNLAATREKADKLVDYFSWNSSSSFTMSVLGVDINNDVLFEGFEETHNHTMPLRDVETNFYRQKFLAAKSIP